jgi:hypothetical protein
VLKKKRDFGELSKTGYSLRFEVSGIPVYEFPGDEDISRMSINEVVKKKKF